MDGSPLTYLRGLRVVVDVRAQDPPQNGRESRARVESARGAGGSGWWGGRLRDDKKRRATENDDDDDDDDNARGLADVVGSGDHHHAVR